MRAGIVRAGYRVMKLRGYIHCGEREAQKVSITAWSGDVISQPAVTETMRTGRKAARGTHGYTGGYCMDGGSKAGQDDGEVWKLHSQSFQRNEMIYHIIEIRDGDPGSHSRIFFVCRQDISEDDKICHSRVIYSCQK